MNTRRRFKQQTTLKSRIRDWVEQVQAEAAALPPGADRDVLLEKVRQAETALRWSEPSEERT